MARPSPSNRAWARAPDPLRSRRWHAMPSAAKAHSERAGVAPRPRRQGLETGSARAHGASCPLPAHLASHAFKAARETTSPRSGGLGDGEASPVREALARATRDHMSAPGSRRSAVETSAPMCKVNRLRQRSAQVGRPLLASDRTVELNMLHLDTAILPRDGDAVGRDDNDLQERSLVRGRRPVVLEPGDRRLRLGLVRSRVGGRDLRVVGRIRGENGAEFPLVDTDHPCRTREYRLPRTGVYASRSITVCLQQPERLMLSAATLDGGSGC